MQPLVLRMQTEVHASRVIWTDDTTLPVLDDDRERTRTGRMWVDIGDLRHRFAVFDDSPDRKGIRPRKFPAGDAGHLKADTYSGYDELVDRGPATEVACWAHARREFVEAKEAAPIGAAYAIARIKELDVIEHRATAKKLSAADTAELRHREAAPKLAAFEAWLDEQRATLLPKSPLARAVWIDPILCTRAYEIRVWGRSVGCPVLRADPGDAGQQRQSLPGADAGRLGNLSSAKLLALSVSVRGDNYRLRRLDRIRTSRGKLVSHGRRRNHCTEP